MRKGLSSAQNLCLTPVDGIQGNNWSKCSNMEETVLSKELLSANKFFIGLLSYVETAWERFEPTTTLGIRSLAL